MLHHPTLTALEALKLTGMATALAEQLEMPEIQRLNFEERLGLLVDCERMVRDNHRLARRLAQARFPSHATLEDLDYRHPQGLDKSVIASLAADQWIRHHDNVLIVGPTGALAARYTRLRHPPAHGLHNPAPHQLLSRRSQSPGIRGLQHARRYNILRTIY